MPKFTLISGKSSELLIYAFLFLITLLFFVQLARVQFISNPDGQINSSTTQGRELQHSPELGN